MTLSSSFVRCHVAKGLKNTARNSQRFAFLVFAGLLTTIASAGLPYQGVNLSGAEFGQQNLPGTYNGVGSGPYDYIYPPSGEVDYFLDKGMNTFRLPFRWERLQRTLGGDLHAAELGRMDAFVNHTTASGGHVILDPHNFARYHDDVIGRDVSSGVLADFWSKVATRYKDNPRVIFGLMNEPHSMRTETWLGAANDSIQAIRDTGAKNLILVPGNGWTGAHGWDASYYGTPNSRVMVDVVDPLNNFAFEVHQYLDSDSSGSTSQIVNEDIGVDRLVGFTDWLKDNNYRGFLGEFAAANSRIGTGNSQIGDETINKMLDHLEANNDVWMGWAWWGGGPWWGDYLFAIDREGRSDRPSMNLLEPRLSQENPFLPGDYNDDGLVDAGDFSIWRDHLGSETWLPGDTTPGLVSQDDYQVWSDFFGTRRLNGSSAAAAVPEPTALNLVLIALLAFAIGRRRQ